MRIKLVSSNKGMKRTDVYHNDATGYGSIIDTWEQAKLKDEYIVLNGVKRPEMGWSTKSRHK